MNQLQYNKKVFRNYNLYATGSLNEILTPEEQNLATTLEIHTFSSVIFENKGTYFKQHVLPVEGQLSPIFDYYIFTKGQNQMNKILLADNDNAQEVCTGPKNTFKGDLVTIDNFLVNG